MSLIVNLFMNKSIIYNLLCQSKNCRVPNAKCCKKFMKFICNLSNYTDNTIS